jgi:hypothetical protein
MMKRVVILFCLALVAATKSEKSPGEALRERVKEFNQAWIKEDYAVAARCVNPDLLEAAGEDKIKDKLREFMTTLKGGAAAYRRKISGFNIRRVTIEKDNVNATVLVHFITGEGGGNVNRREFPCPQKWALKDKTWYWGSSDPSQGKSQ